MSEENEKSAAKHVCEICGVELKSVLAVRCSHCKRVVDAMKSRLYKRQKKTGTPYSFAEAIEMARAKVAEEEAREREEDEKNGGAGRPRCKYCGSKRHVKESGFCRSCIRDGFDSVYRITHRSNGWDRVLPEGAKVVGGWRGQRVAGGGQRIADIRVAT